MAESVVTPEYLPQNRIALPISNRIRLLLIGFLIGGAYYVGAMIGFALTFPTDAVSTLWPPNAIVLAALLLTPTRSWWLVLLSVFPAHLAVQLQSGVPFLMVLSWFVSNCSEALIGAWGIRRFINGRLNFDTLKNVSVFIFFAVFLAPFLSSFLDAAFVALVGWKADSYWDVWRMRFPSNVLAALTLVPVIVDWFNNLDTWLRRTSLQRYAEASLLIFGLVIVSFLVFAGQTAGPGAAPTLVYIPLPFLLWAAVRFGPGGAATSLLVVVLLSIWGATQGRGPFVTSSPEENVLSLQIFLIAISLPLMFLAALIEERRENEKALRESEARYRALVMAGAEMVWRANANGEGLFDSASWQDLTGQSKVDMRNSGWLDAVHPDDRERSALLWQHSVMTKRAYENELRVRTRDGSFRHFHVHAVPILAPDGSVYEWVGANTDITERKQAAEALRESEERLARTEKFSLVMVTHTDLEGRWTKVPPTLCELLGYTEKELLGRRFHDVTHPDDLEAHSTKRLRLLQGDARSFDLEKRYIRKDGSIVWVDINVSVVANEEGNPVHCLSYIRDITERKRAEEELRESEARFRNMANTTPVMIWMSGPDKLCTFFSKGWLDFTGRMLEEELGNGWTEGIHLEDLDRCMTLYTSSFDVRQEFTQEYRLLRYDGEYCWVLDKGLPRFAPDGTFLGYIGSCIDITERKQGEEEIRRLKERLEAENVYLREEVTGGHRFAELTGESEPIAKVIQQVEQVAATDMTVLLLGETGTGKELVARAVHARSTRKERPLVKVNCSALPAELIESELFGHEKGAFTGATARQTGRFELADGTTLFLDEIGELPLELQAKLLRVLQEGEFERLGSGKTIRVDVRVIAATNRDLVEAIQTGRFRADLYYRLAVYPIQLPPLRERKEDIEQLATAFLKEASRRLGRTFGSIPPSVMEALRRYDWPGNVRELQNVIERAAVISTGRVLQLPPEWEMPLAQIEPPATSMAQEEALVRSSEEPVNELTLDQFERTHIIQVLEQTGWRIEGTRGAARILGLNPSTLRSRMRKLGIRRPVRPLTAERMH